MDDFFMSATPSNLGKGHSTPGLDLPGVDALNSPSMDVAGEPASMALFSAPEPEIKTSESGAEKKRPLMRDAMMTINNHHIDGKSSQGLNKLPAHFQVSSSNFEWNSQCPSFMSTHSWRGISTELRKDLKVGEWAYSCSSKEMWWSLAVHQIFDAQPPFTPPSFEQYRGLLHPDDRDQVLFLFQRAIERGIPYDVTHRLYLPNKTIKWCRCMCRIQFHSVTKKVEKLIGTLQDISSWAQSIKTNILVESEDKNEIIIDEANLDEEPACSIC
mmetsp:Transcript_5443/g.7570  ORF Transcript_5443/g.7570 Transcript_5443/m.7570 type:complete len:271 (+) Transcript_5443:232-1044(+)